jgi:Fe-S-cluster containining protein
MEVTVDCHACGACCLMQDAPPGYCIVTVKPDRRPRMWPEDTGDIRRLLHLPDDALAAILDRLEDEHVDRPCCWLDMETMRCRWYEHRPSICRDFEVGSEAACQSWRVDVHEDGDTL